MPSGTVKWFNIERGFGFIGPDDGGKDLFVRISAVQRAGMEYLREGAKVTFDVVDNRGKPVADNLRLKRIEIRTIMIMVVSCVSGSVHFRVWSASVQ